MSENIIWNDLYGPALANMKSSPTHMQPHTTHSGRPTEGVPSCSGVGPELWLCGSVHFICRNMNTKLGWCETLEPPLRCDPGVCGESSGFQPVGRRLQVAKATGSKRHVLGSHFLRIGSRRSRAGPWHVSSETAPKHGETSSSELFWACACCLRLLWLLSSWCSLASHPGHSRS